MIGLTITTHYEGVTDLTEQETHPECVGHHPMGWGGGLIVSIKEKAN